MMAVLLRMRREGQAHAQAVVDTVTGRAAALEDLDPREDSEDRAAVDTTSRPHRE